MKYYAVIDTNVLVSAMLKSSSVPNAVMKMAFDGRISPLHNEAILGEYREVLSRPKFHLTKDIVDSIIQEIIQNGVNVEAEDLALLDFPDPKDVVFYEVVMEQRKTDDAYLVTGNIKHFPVKPFVVTPRQMLDLILSEQNEE